MTKRVVFDPADTLVGSSVHSEVGQGWVAVTTAYDYGEKWRIEFDADGLLSKIEGNAADVHLLARIAGQVRAAQLFLMMPHE